jgi:hypothetical protein
MNYNIKWPILQTPSHFVSLDVLQVLSRRLQYANILLIIYLSH